MRKIKIGVFAFTKASWLTPKIERMVDATVKNLRTIPDAEILFDGLVCDEAASIRQAERFAAERVDAVIMYFVTFPAGVMIPAAATRINAPILLLANPEVPGPGKLWEQNSFCGANMAAHGMNRLRKRYSFTFASPEETAAKLAPSLAAVRAVSGLKALKIGLAGGRVPGFYTSNFDELQLRRDFGTAVEVLELLEVVDTARKLDGAELDAARKVVKENAAGCRQVADGDLELAARLFGAFCAVAQKYRLDGYAVRCWPELSDIFGIAPCAVLGMLSSCGLGTACEGDVNGAVTMKLLEFLAGGGIAFFVDLISFDERDNTGVVWHCGAAPTKLCRKFAETTYRLHMRVDGGDKKGLTCDFPLKPGRVTIAKFDLDADNRPRMLIVPGEALDTEDFLRGNPLRIRFDAKVKQLIDTVMDRGFEHHYAVIHADVVDGARIFCKWLGIEPVFVG